MLNLFLCLLSMNPFLIDFPVKEKLTSEDYLTVQEKLRAMNIEPLLKELYVRPQEDFTTYEDFYARCNKGFNLVLIDPEKGLYPRMNLEKIGQGGDRCVVTYTSFNNVYPSFVRDAKENLEKCGFNGYYLYQIGGYPNPTGKEIRFAGVPYAFKFFMLEEAAKLGFTKVLWIDSAVRFLCDPTPLFEQIETFGGCFMRYEIGDTSRYLLPATRTLLQEQSGVDVAHPPIFLGAIFGLDFASDKGQLFMRESKRYIEMGTPFLSCFCEMFVFVAIIEGLHLDEFEMAGSRIPIAVDSKGNMSCFFALQPH